MRWNIWFTDGIVVFKWEFEDDLDLWVLSFQKIAGQRALDAYIENAPSAVEAGIEASRVHAVGRYASLHDARIADLTSVFKRDPGGRILLHPRMPANATIPETLVDEAFHLPEPVHPETAEQEGWPVNERHLLQIIDADAASILFWDGAFVHAEFKNQSVGQVRSAFESTASDCSVEAEFDPRF